MTQIGAGYKTFEQAESRALELASSDRWYSCELLCVTKIVHPRWKVVLRCGEYHVRSWQDVPCRFGTKCTKTDRSWCCPFHHDAAQVDGVEQIGAGYMTRKEAQDYIDEQVNGLFVGGV